MNRYLGIFVISSILTLSFHGCSTNSETAYNFSQKAIENVPDIVQMANSPNLNDRISIIDKLIIRNEHSDYMLYHYAYDLPPEDYLASSMSVLEGGLITLNDTERVQDIFGKIMQATIQYKQNEILPEAVKFLEYDDTIVKIQSFIILERLEAKQYAKEIVKAASNPNRDISDLAIQMLIKFDVKEAMPILISCLKNEGSRYKRGAIESLGRIGDPSAIPDLIPFLKTELRVLTINTLISLDAKEALPYIKELYKPDKEYEDRTHILIALAYFGDEQAISDIMTTMNDEDYYNGNILGEYYLDELVVKNVQPIIPALIKALEEEQTVGGQADRGSNIVHRMLVTLGELNAKEAIPVLKKYLNPHSKHSHLNVSFESAAIEALGLMMAKEAIPELQQRLDSKDSHIRSKAAITLARIGEPSTIGNLIAAMRKHKIRDPEIFEELIPVSDPNNYHKFLLLELSDFEQDQIDSNQNDVNLSLSEYLNKLSEIIGVKIKLSKNIAFPEGASISSFFLRRNSFFINIRRLYSIYGMFFTYYIWDDTVYIVTIEEGLDFWDNWFDEYTKNSTKYLNSKTKLFIEYSNRTGVR